VVAKVESKSLWLPKLNQSSHGPPQYALPSCEKIEVFLKKIPTNMHKNLVGLLPKPLECPLCPKHKSTNPYKDFIKLLMICSIG